MAGSCVCVKHVKRVCVCKKVRKGADAHPWEVGQP